jgi:2-iminobutanoate/2-iminopropanoate deaminase
LRANLAATSCTGKARRGAWTALADATSLDFDVTGRSGRGETRRRDAFMGAIIHHMLDRAPAPVAPFSHAVETDGWVFVTGQIPENPESENDPLPVGIEAQTRRVMDNLKLVLAEIGLGLEHVVAARAFLIDMREFETMNKIYASYFPPNKRPARTCIGVTGLAKGARVEIDFIARRP